MMPKLSYQFHGAHCVGVNDVVDLESYKASRISAMESVVSDERATGAQLVAQWLGLAPLYPDEMARHLELLASAIDESVKVAGSYEELRALLTQISNGARGEVARIGRSAK